MCVAIPMAVKSIEGQNAVVEQEGTSLRVRTDLLEGVAVGDYVLVHAGFAIQRIDPKEAEETLALFQEIADASR